MVDCVDCEKLAEANKKIRELQRWKRRATRILLDIYGMGADIEKVIPVVKDDSKT